MKSIWGKNSLHTGNKQPPLCHEKKSDNTVFSFKKVAFPVLWQYKWIYSGENTENLSCCEAVEKLPLKIQIFIKGLPNENKSLLNVFITLKVTYNKYLMANV